MKEMVKLFYNDIFEVAVKLDNGEWVFDAEKVARNLGFEKTDNKNGKEYKSIRWSTVNEYLDGFLQEVGEIKKGDFIPESAVYKLAFKSRSETAEQFQDWLAIKVLPTLRKEGAYITEKANPNMLRKKANEIESTQTINEALNIVLPILQKAKVSPESLALTTKEFYKKAGINLPIDINAEEHYLTVTDLAEYCGMYTKNDKPATQALSCILKEIPIADSEKKIVWEQKGNWQGSTVKYKKSLIDKIAEWVGKHGFPTKIKTDKRTYTVKYEQMNIYKKFA